MDGSAPVSSYSAGDHRWALISLVLSQNHNHGESTFPFLRCSVLSNLDLLILSVLLLEQSL